MLTFNEPEPLPPTPSTEQDFSYSHDGFRHGWRKIARDPPSLLRQTLPNDATWWMTDNAQKKTWLAAQCAHWGIPMRRPLDSQDLRLSIILALREGGSIGTGGDDEVEVPAEVAAIEARLKGEWEDRVRRHELEVQE